MNVSFGSFCPPPPAGVSLQKRSRRRCHQLSPSLSRQHQRAFCSTSRPTWADHGSLRCRSSRSGSQQLSLSDRQKVISEIDPSQQLLEWEMEEGRVGSLPKVNPPPYLLTSVTSAAVFHSYFNCP